VKTQAEPNALAAEVSAGDRRALARAITLVESTRAEDRAAAEALLSVLMPKTGRAARIGITGAPGVGKSTFIEAFGRLLTGRGKRVAVLAVDPSSRKGGGSILGDKTRMIELARDPNAFIRPSPAGTTLGGVARRTREALLLCEAAGFDVVLVETVGVGQSEVAVADMVDMFVLLLSPGGGDELQGIKRGIMELADLAVVTKADGDLIGPARIAAGEVMAAFRFMRASETGWRPEVRLVSAIEGLGLDEVWTSVERYRATLGPKGLAARRAEQARAWMWSEVSETLLADLRQDPRTAALAEKLEAEVAAGRLAPSAAARRLLAERR
jgi:LAO/AO transport system kinase